ncbi:MAG: GtrA family protein [Patescibacteria group bacterium]|nr:GtrA family protein [Patescibacteria group bacterium]
MKKADIILAILSGEGVAWLFYGLIKGSGLEEIFGIGVALMGWILFISFPILTLFALWISFLIGKKFLFVSQAAKFFLTGVMATLIDLGILNVLFWFFGLATGLTFSVFKGISFLVATLAKYWGNKFWAFEKSEMTGVKKEFTQFFVVTLIGLGINVGVASFIVDTVGPQYGIPLQVWINISALFAAVVGFIWNFSGYKFIVFKK